MSGKRVKLDKIFARSFAISCVVILAVASLIILSNQHLPSQVVAFVRSLASGEDRLGINQSESDIDSDLEDDGPRLPTDVVPKAYDINIAVNLSTMTFSGEVKIIVLCKVPTDKIVLHAKHMAITKTNVTKAKSGKLLEIKSKYMKPKYDHYVIELEQELQKHKKYVIIMKYSANISKSLDGFYKSYYTTELGERRPLVATKFEANNARRALPCFDEPALKAKFTMHISRDPTHQSLSNMPRNREERKRVDLVIDHYDTSPPMSTYTLAFLVHDLKYQETTTASGVKMRVYAPPKDKDKLGFALNISSLTLTFYEKLLGSKFPLKKLDLVAMPDFAMGGMENWGLITFRREFLVYHDNFISVFTKEKMMNVISHELAHMWFGNLVTMKWWDDLWLNEGFATFFAYLACYNIDKETDQLALSTMRWENALEEDGKQSTIPLVHAISQPKYRETVFSSIYGKGPMILKMLMNTLGNSAFLEGLKIYLRENKYGNVESADLWTALSKVGKRLDLLRLMKSWMEEKSFPIVTLKRLKGPEKDLILTKQESFLEHKLRPLFNDKPDSKTIGNKSSEQSDYKEWQKISGSLWHIPLTYTVQSTAFKEYTVWLDKKWEKLSVLDPVGWIKANVRANGYYIVNYDKANWIKLIKQLKNYHVVFSPSDRAGLIHDAFVLACEGILDATIPLKLIIYMPKEDHFVPMKMLRQKSKCLEKHFKTASLRKLYKEYIWYLQEHLLEKLGLEDKGGTLDQMNRYYAIQQAIHHRPRVKKKFEKIFRNMKKSKDFGATPKNVSPNIRRLALEHGFNKQDPDDWEYLWNLYQRSPCDADRRFLRSSLVSFDKPDLFTK
ncbi:endoplasmic reticulum aminopeptidase 1-like [Dendronephthya gigantea]|uniref:endoplasmic reticulum aminopeptidase 1-like n=1 Tax=Dendronephthya gigantea TaxID=151771 RepID=UPI00106A8938|nr:endoplasmic reticulum aminopeptidase 1-like [Dendronephthya gigantea]